MSKREYGKVKKKSVLVTAITDSGEKRQAIMFWYNVIKKYKNILSPEMAFFIGQGKTYTLKLKDRLPIYPTIKCIVFEPL